MLGAAVIIVPDASLYAPMAVGVSPDLIMSDKFVLPPTADITLSKPDTRTAACVCGSYALRSAVGAAGAVGATG